MTDTTTKIKHVTTFTSAEFPDKSSEVYSIIGNAKVQSVIKALEEAFAETGHPHKVETNLHKVMEKRGPRVPKVPPATVPPIQEPDPAPVAEVPHGKPAAA